MLWEGADPQLPSRSQVEDKGWRWSTSPPPQPPCWKSKEQAVGHRPDMREAEERIGCNLFSAVCCTPHRMRLRLPSWGGLQPHVCCLGAAQGLAHAHSPPDPIQRLWCSVSLWNQEHWKGKCCWSSLWGAGGLSVGNSWLTEAGEKKAIIEARAHLKYFRSQLKNWSCFFHCRNYLALNHTDLTCYSAIEKSLLWGILKIITTKHFKRNSDCRLFFISCFHDIFVQGWIFYEMSILGYTLQNLIICLKKSIVGRSIFFKLSH